MIQTIRGLHHVTAIAIDPQTNIDFYTQVLGLRLVKDTVNFDDPSTYQFYYGDKSGNPGTILTFFPFVSAGSGRRFCSRKGCLISPVSPVRQRETVGFVHGRGVSSVLSH